MDAVLILNRSAGSLNGDRDAVTPDAVRQAFAGHDMRVEVRLAAPRELPGALQRAAADRPGAVLVGGGDGTVSTAAGVFAGKAVPLGVLPLGTLNHFARDLGFPADWREAVVALAGGVTRRVDVAEVNGRVFINNCSIGSYPEAVRRRDQLRRQHGRRKWVAMALASLEVFRRLRRFHVCIETPDTSQRLKTPFVFVGNNRYSGHLLNSSLRPRLDEGRLSIFTTRAGRKGALLRLAWQSLVHSVDVAEGLEALLAAGAAVSSPTGERLPVAVDGELVDLVPPFRFRVRPGALTVLAPPEATSTGPGRTEHAVATVVR